jgi:hypothetical protein
MMNPGCRVEQHNVHGNETSYDEDFDEETRDRETMHSSLPVPAVGSCLAGEVVGWPGTSRDISQTSVPGLGA